MVISILNHIKIFNIETKKFINEKYYISAMKITITGTPGSGKTTLGKLLAEKLGYDFYSIGTLRRKMARHLNLSLTELNKLGEEKDFTDTLPDEFTLKLSSLDNLVVEGRMAPFILKKSIKIFLYTQEDVAKKRIEKAATRLDRTSNVNERIQKDKERFKAKYGVDIYDLKFDIKIDTTNLLIDEVLEEILKKLKQYGVEVKS